MFNETKTFRPQQMELCVTCKFGRDECFRGLIDSKIVVSKIYPLNVATVIYI